MAFTVQELDNITAASLDFHMKGDAWAQTIQKKPLLDALTKNQKTFAGGAGYITMPVQGDYSVGLQGYTHNDTVSYQNPANLKRVKYPWKELHAGITVTYTELKIDGITVDGDGEGGTSEKSGRDVTVLTGLLKNKLDDMAESQARKFDAMLHKDGTQDAKEVPGILALIAKDPSTGTVGGLSRATNTWWRNRSLVDNTATGGADSRITPSTSLQTLTKTLRSEIRQLRRYGKGRYILISGSRFLEALDAEVAEKGQYTQDGFMKQGSTEIGMGEVSMRGVGTFVYDPTLDDLSMQRFCYFVDLDSVFLDVMEGEEWKRHNPERPYNQYSLYKAVTWTGGMCARQLNTSAVYEVNF